MQMIIYNNKLKRTVINSAGEHQKNVEQLPARNIKKVVFLTKTPATKGISVDVHL